MKILKLEVNYPASKRGIIDFYNGTINPIVDYLGHKEDLQNIDKLCDGDSYALCMVPSFLSMRLGEVFHCVGVAPMIVLYAGHYIHKSRSDDKSYRFVVCILPHDIIEELKQ